MEAGAQVIAANAAVSEVPVAAITSASEGAHASALPAVEPVGPAVEIGGSATHPGLSEAEGAGLLEPAKENGGSHGFHTRRDSVASMHSDSGKAEGRKESVSLEILKGAVNFAYAFGAIRNWAPHKNRLLHEYYLSGILLWPIIRRHA